MIYTLRTLYSYTIHNLFKAHRKRYIRGLDLSGKVKLLAFGRTNGLLPSL